MSNNGTQGNRRRNELSSCFVTMLIALAYQEAMAAVKVSSGIVGIDLATVLLAAIFFCVSARFFIGNLSYMLGSDFERAGPYVWLYDLLVIIAQSMVIILIGTASSIEANQGSKFGFLEFVFLLYAIDIGWILPQWVIGKCVRGWEREHIPIGWAVLNFFLVILMWLCIIIFSWYLGEDPYSCSCLTSLLILNLVAAVVDVVLLDYVKALNWEGVRNSG